jgi:hypothetical protein
MVYNHGNNSMQRTALRAAADAERCCAYSMNETATTDRGSKASAPSRRVTPIWLDAFLFTVLAHLAFAVDLRFTGWTLMAAEWLQLPTQLLWWLIYFLPGFLFLMFVAFLFRPHQFWPLVIGTFALFSAIALFTPRFQS